MTGGPLAQCKLVAFVGTSDQARAREFYGTTLGLPLVSEDGFAVVFDAHGTHLRVTTVPHVVAAPYTVLSWLVDDLPPTVRTLTAAGVHFEHFPGMAQDELGIWTAPGGARVAWFKDPDGNLLSLTQAPAAE